MLLTKILRRFILILVSLFGLLILAGIVVWIDVLNELLNPTEIIAIEDKYLGPGIFIFVYYFAAVIEVIAMAALTRCRWVPYKRGKISIWLLSILGLSQVLFYIGMTNAIYGEAFYHPGGFWALIFWLPFGLACFWVRKRSPAQP